MNGISLPASKWGENYASLKGITADGILKGLNNSGVGDPVSHIKNELGSATNTVGKNFPQFVTFAMSSGLANSAIGAASGPSDDTVQEQKSEKQAAQQQAAQQQRRKQGLMSPGMGPGMSGPSFSGGEEG